MLAGSRNCFHTFQNCFADRALLAGCGAYLHASCRNLSHIDRGMAQSIYINLLGFFAVGALVTNNASCGTSGLQYGFYHHTEIMSGRNHNLFCQDLITNAALFTSG